MRPKRKSPESASALPAGSSDTEKLVAKLAIDGSSGTMVVDRYLNSGGSTTLCALKEAQDQQAGAISGGDLSALEGMLLSQATALQAMFFDLALRAKNQDRFEGIQTLTNLALKAAAGSRQAIVALGELRMPKQVMFAHQANIAAGPQQVNNGAGAPPGDVRSVTLEADRGSTWRGYAHQQARVHFAAGQTARSEIADV
jgi:hypothetical protein